MIITALQLKKQLINANTKEHQAMSKRQYPLFQQKKFFSAKSLKNYPDSGCFKCFFFQIYFWVSVQEIRICYYTAVLFKNHLTSKLILRTSIF